MRGTATAHLQDGPYAGAYVQVEVVDGTPSTLVYFALVEDRVRPMPRQDVDDRVLKDAHGRWQLYRLADSEPVEGAWRYRVVQLLRVTRVRLEGRRAGHPARGLLLGAG